jgi:hypothetical protein
MALGTMLRRKALGVLGRAAPHANLVEGAHLPQGLQMRMRLHPASQ